MKYADDGVVLALAALGLVSAIGITRKRYGSTIRLSGGVATGYGFMRWPEKLPTKKWIIGEIEKLEEEQGQVLSSKTRKKLERMTVMDLYVLYWKMHVHVTGKAPEESTLSGSET